MTRQPCHILPPGKSDQLCHAVIKPRTIHPLRKSIYSDSFQMQEQRGTFGGIDTSNITSYHNFSFRSKLLSESESRSIINRPDINSLLTQLVEEKKISKIAANEKRLLAKRLYEEFDFDPYLCGGTYVPIEKAMMIHRARNSPIVEVTIDDIDDQNEITIKTKKNWPSTLYLHQNMNKWGVRFWRVPAFQQHGANDIGAINIWVLSSLLIALPKLWEIVNNQQLRTSKWYGWLLTYLTRVCDKVGGGKEYKSPFSWNKIRTINRIKEKVIGSSPSELLEDLEGVRCLDLIEEQINLEEEGEPGPKIIISYPHYDYLDELTVNGNRYECRYVSTTLIQQGNKWDGEMFMRHGGTKSNWWRQKRHDWLAIQSELGVPTISPQGSILAFVKIEDVDVKKLRQEFMRNIGGQDYAYCQEHKTPLIRSIKKEKKCNCGGKEYYSCSNLMCNVNICKVCLSRCNKEEITYIAQEPSNANDDDDSSHESSVQSIDPHPPLDEHFNNESDTDSSTQEDDEDALLHLLVNDSDNLNIDDFDDFVTSTFDCNVGEDAYDEDDIRDPNAVPFSDTGDVPIEIKGDYKKKGAYEDIDISGYTILNNCGSLLTRPLHLNKGSAKQNFFIQKITSTSIGKAIPLLFPEATLFPGIFFSSAEDDCSMIGAIPASLLSENSTRYGFADLQTLIRSRLTSPLSATSTDPRYISFLYDGIETRYLASRRHSSARWQKFAP